MHKRLTSLLALLLGLQLLLAWGLGRQGDGVAEVVARGTLLDVAAGQVDVLQLEGPEGARVLLQRSADGWILPDLGDGEVQPAYAERVERLLEQLLALQSSGPLASSDSAQVRLRVTDEDFERRITLRDEDAELAVLYLGSAPDMRHMHARVAGQSAVHRVAISAWQVPVVPQDWLPVEPNRAGEG